MFTYYHTITIPTTTNIVVVVVVVVVTFPFIVLWIQLWYWDEIVSLSFDF